MKQITIQAINLEKALIIGRTGKTTGQSKFLVNINYIGTCNLSNLDFTIIKSWRYLQGEVLLNETSDLDDIQILDAKMKGIKKWKIHKIFQEERNKDKNMICYIGCCKEKQKKRKYI